MAKKRILNYLIVLTVLTLVTGIGGMFFLQYVLPEYYFSTYPFIPIYFYASGILFAYLFERIRKNIQDKTLLLYASLRMIKLMFSIIVLVIYGYGVGIQTKEFLFTFIVFYLIYLTFETLFFFNIETRESRRLKAKKNNKTN